jgi:hypothetical protein
MKYLYGIFLPNGTWCMETSRKRALEAGKGWWAEVKRMRWPESDIWDAPTFKMCSETIARFS